jgi:ABC-type dipeptide/oligopeptide/nickel transport system permease component
MLPVLWGVTTIVFLMLYLLPGDPVLAILHTGGATSEQVEQLRRQLGFDQPLSVQYVRWLGRILRGDLGRSVITDRPVGFELRSQLLNTVQLALAAVALALLLGSVLGTVAGYYRGSWLDAIATSAGVFGVSMPNFWFGFLLIFLFSFKLRLFPAVGQGSVGHLVLPAVTLALQFSAVITRLLRSSLLEVLSQEYVLVARSKGLSEIVVLGKHALRNAVIPITTIVGLQFGDLLAGTVVVETVFARQGIGRLIVEGILSKDTPIVQGAVLLTALGYVLTNLLVDISYVFLDPQIRYG